MRDRRMDSANRLFHIKQSIKEIENFICGKDEEEFIQNSLLHNAVLMQFIIIGETIIHVDNDILKRYDYSWYKIRAFRNLIAHEYFNIKLSAVWEVTQRDLGKLKLVIDTIIKTEFHKDNFE